MGEWIDAEDLKVGMPLSTYEGTDLVHSGTVTSVERIEETQTMYNLTVDTAHTFFVGEGQWLVHNTNYGCGESLGEIASRIANHARPHLKKDLVRAGIDPNNFDQHIVDTISRIESSPLRDQLMTTLGNKTYFWDDFTRSIIIINPRAKNLGTVFKPDQGFQYFREIVEGKRR